MCLNYDENLYYEHFHSDKFNNTTICIFFTEFFIIGLSLSFEIYLRARSNAWRTIYKTKEWKPSEVFRHHISTFLSGHTIWASAYHMVVHYYVRVVSLNWFGCESLVDSEELWQKKCQKYLKLTKTAKYAKMPVIFGSSSLIGKS